MLVNSKSFTVERGKKKVLVIVNLLRESNGLYQVTVDGDVYKDNIPERFAVAEFNAV